MALGVLAEVAVQPETTFDVFESLRMRGQYCRWLGRNAEAIAFFEQSLALADSNAELQRNAPSYGSAVQQLASLLVADGRTTDAQGVNQRILGAPEGTFPDRILTSAMCTQVQLLARLNARDEAVAVIDNLFAKFPDFGSHDGNAISYRVLRAELRDPTMSSDAYVAELAGIWDAPAYRDRLDIVDVGLLLAETHRRRGDSARAIQQDQTTVDRVDELLQSVPAPQDVQAVQRAQDARRTALVSMSTAHESGQPDVAITALVRLHRLSNDLDERAQLAEEVRRLGGPILP